MSSIGICLDKSGDRATPVYSGVPRRASRRPSHKDRRKGNVNPSGGPRPPASGRCATRSGAGLKERCPQQWPSSGESRDGVEKASARKHCYATCFRAGVTAFRPEVEKGFRNRSLAPSVAALMP
jgi:hypothetical protein